MRRRTFLLGLAFYPLALAACGSGNPVARLMAASHKPPNAPAQLRQLIAGGQSVAANGWTNLNAVRLDAALSSPEDGARLIPEVEFVPAGQPFTGSPTVRGRAGDSSVAGPQ